MSHSANENLKSRLHYNLRLRLYPLNKLSSSEHFMARCKYLHKKSSIYFQKVKILTFVLSSHAVKIYNINRNILFVFYRPVKSHPSLNHPPPPYPTSHPFNFTHKSMTLSWLICFTSISFKINSSCFSSIGQSVLKPKLLIK